MQFKVEGLNIVGTRTLTKSMEGVRPPSWTHVRIDAYDYNESCNILNTIVT